ncbi:MAG: PP2C family protein-serine/threonine phosphatase [Acidimicrobiales bacterium]
MTRPTHGRAAGLAEGYIRLPMVRRDDALIALGVFIGYVAGARLAFTLLAVSGLGAVLFVPAGITVAALVLSPIRRWWLILAAAASAEWLLDVWLADYTLPALVGFIVANLLEPVVGASIVRNRVGRPDLSRSRDLAVFLAGAVVVGPACGALIGAAAAQLEDPTLGYGPTLLQWWLGDGLGALVIGAAIVAMVASPDRRPLRSTEGGVLVGGSTVAAVGAYWLTDLPVGFILLMIMVTAGARFGTRAVSIVSAIVVLVAVTSLPATGSLMAGVADPEAMILVKLQIAAFSIAGLVVAAEANARERAVAVVALERQTVVDLQHALLPPSSLAGEVFTAEGAYTAANTRLAVGGDWYDVTELDGDRVFVSVGDVVGHGSDAVVVMGQLRFAMAAFASLDPSPSQVLERLDRRVARLPGALGTTVWAGCYDGSTGVLTYSAAGHPPALLGAGDQWRWLDDGRSAPLGVGHGTLRPEGRVEAGGRSLVVFTDGVVERRGEVLDHGLDRLRLALEAGTVSAAATLAQLVPDENFDDAVLLRVELLPRR